MSAIWGHNIRLSIFGESHGKSIGIVIDGLPAGIKLDLTEIKREMQRRAPGNSELTTPRKEKDEFEIYSGYFNNHTTGGPVCCMIHNSDQHSKDYEAIKDNMRPGHGDYTGYVKHFGFNDYRGGGHFSGRITAPLVFAGAIAKQLLKIKNITIGSHIRSIGVIEEELFDLTQLEMTVLQSLSQENFPVLNLEKGEEMKRAILSAKENKDSLGGVVETAIINLPVGVGEPFFDSIESKLAQLIFSIPAVKGIEFGAGFDIAKMKGSQANDAYQFEGTKVKAITNHNGGIVGGISNGMPIVLRTAIKPTPSIGLTQDTVNMKSMENTKIKIKGRHDPCIVPRAIPVIEAVIAIGLLDLLIEKEGRLWIK